MSRPSGNSKVSKASKAVAVGAAVALPFTLAACGGESTAGPERGADVEDVSEDDWFDTNDYIGEKVTVSSTVLSTLSSHAFVLAGEEYGDDSLLVLTKSDISDLVPGMAVQVTGTVRTFTYSEYVDPYGLDAVDPALFEPYEEEEFLAAKKIDKTIDTATPTAPATS